MGSRAGSLLFGTLAVSACFVDAVGEGDLGQGGGTATGPGPTSSSPSVTTSTAAPAATSTGPGGAGGQGLGGSGGDGGSCDGFLTFEGAQIAQVDDSPGFASSDAFAFGARVRLHDDPKFVLASDGASQILRHANAGVAAGYALGVGEAANDDAFHPIAGVWLQSGLCDFAPGFIAPIPVDTWTRLDIVYERNNSAGEDLRFYRNGIQEAQRDCPDAPVAAFAGPLEIGATIELPVRALRGDVDDVFIKAGPGFAAVPHPILCGAGFAVALGFDGTLASSCSMPVLEAGLGLDAMNADPADPVLGCR